MVSSLPSNKMNSCYLLHLDLPGRDDRNQDFFNYLEILGVNCFWFDFIWHVIISGRLQYWRCSICAFNWVFNAKNCKGWNSHCRNLYKRPSYVLPLEAIVRFLSATHSLSFQSHFHSPVCRDTHEIDWNCSFILLISIYIDKYYICNLRLYLASEYLYLENLKFVCFESVNKLSKWLIPFHAIWGLCRYN